MTVPPSPQSLVGVIGSRSTKDNKKPNPIIKWFSASWRPVLAEVISTSILLLMGCMACIPIDGIPYALPMYAPLAFGFAVLFNIQIFGHISGAHMNPSVTIAAILWGSMSIPLGIAYILAQCTGAILGYGILMTVSPILLATDGICITQPHPQLDVLQAIGIEVALTTVLNFLNCAVWDPVNKNKPDSVPIKFGLTIAGLSLAGGPLTGASMNPARSLGPAVWTGWWTMHWIYWVGPIIGGILAVLIYKYIWLNMGEKSKDEDQ